MSKVLRAGGKMGQPLVTRTADYAGRRLRVERLWGSETVPGKKSLKDFELIIWRTTHFGNTPVVAHNSDAKRHSSLTSLIPKSVR